MHSRCRRRRDNFSVARFFLKLFTLAKWRRRERIWMLEWLGKEKRRQNNCAWIIFQRVSIMESNDSSILHSLESLSTSLLYRFQVSKFLQNRSFLLPRFFPTLHDSYSFIIHPCVELSLLHSLMYFHSFFAVFAFFKQVHVFNLVYVYLLNKITPNTKNA